MFRNITSDSKTSPYKKSSNDLPNFRKLTACLELTRDPYEMLRLVIAACKPSGDAVNNDYEKSEVSIR